jgi:hypothetical protein
MFNTVTGTNWGTIHLNEEGQLAIVRNPGQTMNKEEVTEILAQIGRRIEGAGWDPRIPNMRCRMYKTTTI